MHQLLHFRLSHLQFANETGNEIKLSTAAFQQSNRFLYAFEMCFSTFARFCPALRAIVIVSLFSRPSQRDSKKNQLYFLEKIENSSPIFICNHISLRANVAPTFSLL